jgi:hypothetical protein
MQIFELAKKMFHDSDFRSPKWPKSLLKSYNEVVGRSFSMIATKKLFNPVCLQRRWKQLLQFVFKEEDEVHGVRPNVVRSK